MTVCVPGPGMDRRRWLPLFAAALILSVLSSCRTLPEPPYPEIVDWLPDECDIIAMAVVPGNEDLIDLIVGRIGMDPSKLDKIAARTALVALGVELNSEPVPAEQLPIHIAAVGTWPKALVGTSLGKGWRRSPIHSYRYNGPDGLELTVLSNNQIVLSRGRTDAVLERIENGVRSPSIARAIDLKTGADFVVWIVEPDPIVSAVPVLPKADADGNPIIDMIGLALSRRDDGGYSAFFVLYPTDDRLSGSLALALRLALSARFGLSSVPEERALLSALVVEIGSGEVRLIIPALSLDMLDGFLGNLDFLNGEGS